MADGVGVRVGVFQVRALAGVGIGKHDLRADFEAGADGLGERVGRLDGHVDRLVAPGGLVRVEDQRHLRQARHGAHPGALQGGRQFQRDDLRAFAQNRLAHLDGELQAARHYRKIGEAPALQASRIRKRKVDFSGHTAALLPPAPERWRFPAPRFRACAAVARLFSLMAKRRHVDAVAHGVALVGGVRQLQKIGHVIQDAFFGEGQVLLQNVVLLVAFREVDEDLRLQPGVNVLGQLESGGVVVHGGHQPEMRDGP